MFNLLLIIRCKYLLEEKGQEYISNIHLTCSLEESLVSHIVEYIFSNVM